MKIFLVTTQFAAFSIFCLNVSAQNTSSNTAAGKKLFIDVYHLQPGKITYADVAAAHAKYLAVKKSMGCNSSNTGWIQLKALCIVCPFASDSESISKTHAEAHGLLPDQVYIVSEGTQAAISGNKNLFLDVHELGAGKVTASDVAAAHQKDLAVQKKYGVNFINTG